MRRARSVAIRPARASDVDALVSIEAVFPTDQIERRSFLHAIRSPTIDLIVVISDDAVLGYAAVHRRRGSPFGRLASIAVSAEASGQGLGRRLLAAAEDEARRHGCTRLRLEVRADNAAAQRLYDGAGYRRLEQVEDYYEDGEAAWRYEKALTPHSEGEKNGSRPATAR